MIDKNELLKIANKVEKHFGKTNLKIRIIKRNAAYVYEHSKIIYIGKNFLKNRTWATITLLHEMGHLYSFPDCSETAANLRMMQIIIKVFPNSINLRKAFWRYILVVLNNNDEDQKYVKFAMQLLKSLGGGCAEISGKKLILLPPPFKHWHPTPLYLPLFTKQQIPL